MAPQQKLCTKCKRPRSNPHDSWCRECNATAKRERYQNSAEVREHQRVYRLENYNHYKELSKKARTDVKVSVISHYSGGTMECNCCGEKHLAYLSIDHLNNNGAAHRREIRTHLYWWLKREGYPEGYQVLCMNCNLAKVTYAICPHLLEPSPADLLGK